MQIKPCLAPNKTDLTPPNIPDESKHAKVHQDRNIPDFSRSKQEHSWSFMILPAFSKTLFRDSLFARIRLGSPLQYIHNRGRILCSHQCIFIVGDSQGTMHFDASPSIQSLVYLFISPPSPSKGHQNKQEESQCFKMPKLWSDLSFWKVRNWPLIPSTLSHIFIWSMNGHKIWSFVPSNIVFLWW